MRNGDGSQNTNNISGDQTSSTIYTNAASDPVNNFPIFKEYQYGSMNVNKNIVNNEFVNSSTLINKAKQLARETNFYLKKLNESILPKCQSAYITNEIIERDDVLSKNFQQSQNLQSSFKEKLETNISKNNEKEKHFVTITKTLSKPKSLFSEKHNVNFENSLENSHELENVQKLCNSSIKIPKSIKTCKNNIGTVNIMATVPVEEENNGCKVNNLSVQQISRIDLKPDLVTQKLTNVQITPNYEKTLGNYKSNVAYHECTFELEQETYKCQLISKIKARSEIHKIVCGMLDSTSTISNAPLNDKLISQLHKIINTLEVTKTSKNNKLSVIEDLVNTHSIVGLDEVVIRNKLLEIAKNIPIDDNDNDVILSDQMSVEIEKDSHQKINSLIINHPIVLPDLSEDNTNNDIKKHVDKNVTNCHSKEKHISDSKNFNDIKSTEYISVKEYLCLGFNNIVDSKIYEHSSIVKEPNFKLCSNEERTIQNSNMFISNQLPKNKNESQTTSLESSLSSKPFSSYPNILSNTLLVPIEEDSKNNKIKNYKTSKYDTININTGINNVYNETNNKKASECDQLSNCQVIENKNINNATIQDYNMKLNTQKRNLNSSLFTSSPTNNNQNTDLKSHLINKETDDSSNTTSSMSSMIAMNQMIQEAEISDTESSISFGEIYNFPGFHKIDFNESVGEIKK